MGGVLLALVCAAATAGLAAGHPLLGPWALPLLLAAAVAAYRAPGAWAFWLLPLLPIVGWMPWTGWLALEELDLLVLATVAGGYLRGALAPTTAPRSRWTVGSALGVLLLCAYGAALAVSLARGVADAGGFAAAGRWSLWQGYHEPTNALRLAKSSVWAVLLVPLWLRLHRTDARQAAEHLSRGMTLALALVALAVVWERVAYTGLTNFSSDYRATGPFWEMHVGGAALDVALALLFPFAVLRALQARQPAEFAFAATALVLAAYAGLVTFSRVVYVAVPLGLVVLLAMHARQREGADAAAQRSHRLVTALLLCGFAASAAVIFPAGGYRGLLATLGVFALALPLGTAVPALSWRTTVAGLLGGALLAALGGLAAEWLPKGPYLSYAAIAAVGAACAVRIERDRRRRHPASPAAAATLLACTLALCAGLDRVVVHWSARDAGATAAVVATLLAAAVLLLGCRRTPPWPASLRWQAGHLALFGVVALVVGVFAGGSYMGGRWSELGKDIETRTDKVSGALALLRGDFDLAFGRGLGRYVATQFLAGSAADHTGDHRWLDDAQGRRLVLTSGKHMLGWGQLYRISQRVEPPGLGVRVRVHLRTEPRTGLHAEVCEKHLLYNGTCLVGHFRVPPGRGGWQLIDWPLQGKAAPVRGSWLAPRWIAFSLALDTPGSRAEISSIELLAADGRQLLGNADFAGGGARWFFSSDHHHMPWHAKNLLAHLLVEQGVAGAALFTLLAAVALGRLVFGSARRHPLAPALAAAVVGAIVVGVADSVLDMPRVAFLLYLVLATALLVNPAARGRPPPASLSRRSAAR